MCKRDYLAFFRLGAGVLLVLTSGFLASQDVPGWGWFFVVGAVLSVIDA